MGLHASLLELPLPCPRLSPRVLPVRVAKNVDIIVASLKKMVLTNINVKLFHLEQIALLPVCHFVNVLVSGSGDQTTLPVDSARKVWVPVPGNEAIHT